MCTVRHRGRDLPKSSLLNHNQALSSLKHIASIPNLPLFPEKTLNDKLLGVSLTSHKRVINISCFQACPPQISNAVSGAHCRLLTFASCAAQRFGNEMSNSKHVRRATQDSKQQNKGRRMRFVESAMLARSAERSNRSLDRRNWLGKQMSKCVREVVIAVMVML